MKTKYGSINLAAASPPRSPRRRSVLAGLAASGLGLRASGLGAQAPAVVSGRTITISLWGGVTEDSVKKWVQPEFERATGAKLAYDIGGQGARLNKLIAQRNSPPADVIFLTDEAVLTGYAQGVLSPVRRKGVPNAADVFDWMHTIDLHRTAETLPTVPYGVIAAVLAFNPEKVRPAPTSWSDLWRPDLRGKIAFPAVIASTMPAWVIIAAEMAGGGVGNVDPGFRKLAELRPAKLSVFWTDWAPLAKTGDVIAAPDLDYYLETMKQQGYPIDYVIPKEKAIGVTQLASVVKGKNQELAEAFLDILVSRRVQEGLAVDTFQGPVNSKAQVPAAIAARCSCGPRNQQLRMFDPKLISSMRPAWSERMNTEVVPRWGAK